MPTTRVSEETCSLHPSSPVSLIGQEGGSESHWEMQHCLLETRRGETRAGLPAFSILTTERLGHPIPWPQWGHCLPVFPRSTWSSVQNKAPWEPHPKHSGSHHHLGSDTLMVSVLPANVSTLPFPEECTGQQKPDSVTRKDGGAGLPGVTRSDWSHFLVSPPPPTLPSLALCFALAATAAPPLEELQRSPVVAAQAPAQHRALVWALPAWAATPGPSRLSCPSLSSLGAGVSGLWSHVPRGWGLGDPVPPLGEASGAASWGPCSERPVHRSSVSCEETSAGWSQHRWGDDDALRDSEMLRGPLQKDEDIPMDERDLLLWGHKG